MQMGFQSQAADGAGTKRKAYLEAEQYKGERGAASAEHWRRGV